MSISAQELVIATPSADTVRIERKHVKVADVAQPAVSGSAGRRPRRVRAAEPKWVRVKVQQVRRGPAPSLGMPLMF